jgi:DNA-binding response OmpR family regulator
VQIAVITKNDEFFELLLQHNFSRENVSFVKYNAVSEYKNSANIVILASDISETIDNTANVIHIGKDIIRPYKIAELFALIKQKAVNVEYKIDGYLFNYKAKTLNKDNIKIDLTEKEADIIRLLIEASPEIIEKKQLLEEVFGYGGDIDTHTLETHIYRLRKKVNINNDFILNEKGGYKIIIET